MRYNNKLIRLSFLRQIINCSSQRQSAALEKKQAKVDKPLQSVQSFAEDHHKCLHMERMNMDQKNVMQMERPVTVTAKWELKITNVKILQQTKGSTCTHSWVSRKLFCCRRKCYPELSTRFFCKNIRRELSLEVFLKFRKTSLKMFLTCS